MTTREMTTAEPLSSAEAVLWTIERDPTLRSTIVVVALLAEPPDLSRLRERLASAAHVFPRLRQRVQPRRARVPRWVDSGHMDLDHHVRRMQLPTPGTLGDLLDLAGQQAGEAFDPARPLWQMTVVEGLEGDRAAVVIKVHHAMTDGVAGSGCCPPSRTQSLGRRRTWRPARAATTSPLLHGPAALMDSAGSAPSDRRSAGQWPIPSPRLIPRPASCGRSASCWLRPRER